MTFSDAGRYNEFINSYAVSVTRDQRTKSLYAVGHFAQVMFNTSPCCASRSWIHCRFIIRVSLESPRVNWYHIIAYSIACNLMEALILCISAGEIRKPTNQQIPNCNIHAVTCVCNESMCLASKDGRVLLHTVPRPYGDGYLVEQELTMCLELSYSFCISIITRDPKFQREFRVHIFIAA